MLGSPGRALSSMFMSLWRAGKTVLMMMGNTMDNIAERVTGIVVEHLGVEKEKVSESESFLAGLGAAAREAVSTYRGALRRVCRDEQSFTGSCPRSTLKFSWFSSDTRDTWTADASYSFCCMSGIVQPSR